MIKLAGLTKLTCPMFHVVLTNGLVGADGEEGFVGICGHANPSSALHISWVVIFTGSTIFAAASAEVVSTIFAGSASTGGSSLRIG